MKTSSELLQALTSPTRRLEEDMKKIKGDIMVIGAGGKIGPTLCVLAKKAAQLAGTDRRVIAVSLFHSHNTTAYLKENKVDVIDVDLLKPGAVDCLPDISNIIFMAGRKFGTQEDQALTWAINTYLPATIAKRFTRSRIVAFSTGNVYGMRPIYSGGALEDEPLCPVGEYAQSCVGRERLLTYWANTQHIPMLMFRLNYAIDMRYGVLFDIASAVLAHRPVDRSIGYVNCIWQGDAAEYAIRCLLHCDTPPTLLNVTGPESISVTYIANQFAERFNVPVSFTGAPSDSSLFSNAGKMAQLLGYPSVSLNQMLDWTAEWLINGGNTIDAPTHFEQRNGNY